LGAKVNVRSSILGEGGRAKEAQSEFLVLMEDAIRQTDLVQRVQRYQLAVDQTKLRLNLAVCLMAWLMPASMIKQQAQTGWPRDEARGKQRGHKKAALKLMAGRPSKINPQTATLLTQYIVVLKK